MSNQFFADLHELFAKINSHVLFKGITVAIIVLSAAILGVRTYSLPTYYAETIEILSGLVTLYFLLELAVRFAAVASFSKFFSRGWNIFDSIVISISLVPVDNIESVLVMRLIRLVRLMRVFSISPQLRVMVESLMRAVPRISYVALMLFVISYVYGTIGSMFFADINSARWGDIGKSMLTLVQIITFDDWAKIMNEVMAHIMWLWAVLYFFTYIFFVGAVLMNLITSVIVETMINHNKSADPKENGSETR